jgi:hypothetical protein
VGASTRLFVHVSDGNAVAYVREIMINGVFWPLMAALAQIVVLVVVWSVLLSQMANKEGNASSLSE